MKKFLYGVLAFFPIIEVILSVVSMVAGIVLLVLVAMGTVDMSAAVPSILLWLGIGGIILGIILCVVGAVVFTVHAKKNPNLDDKERGKWTALLICLVCFAFPSYWNKCIRKEGTPAVSQSNDEEVE